MTPDANTGTPSSRVRAGPVVQGAVLALLVAGVGLVLGLGAHGTARTAIFTVLAIVGFVVGGFRAGVDGGDTPLMHGAAAGAIAYLPMAVIRVVQRVGGDDPVPWGSIVFASFLTASLGILGAMLASRSKSVRA